MTDEQNSKSAAPQPATYEIRIKGNLSPQWMDWFDGMTVSIAEDGNMLLRGPVIDQSALHGILKKIRDLGMPLLSVNTVDPDRAGDS